MFAQEFVQHALLAGTPIAIASGLVGYFIVLRGQVFAGDALSHVAFTGAVAATLVGIDGRAGLFAGTIGCAFLFGAVGSRTRADDVAIGTTFAWVLGLGVLFLGLAARSTRGGNGVLAAHALFGSIFSLTEAEARLAAVIAVAIAGLLVLIARPLLFATIDPAVASSRGVPVRALGLAFLGLLGVQAAETTQAVGALLLQGLLAAPAGAARRLTSNPYRGLLLSAALALCAMWGGLAASYAIPALPPSSAIVAAASLLFAASFVAPRAGRKGLRVDS
ncbi:MAG: metal ABC transporter permease [Solirubrobacteraceae bacterium]